MIKIIKRMLKSAVVTWIAFLMTNLILIYVVSFLFWASIASVDPYCYGRRPWISPENDCPTWIISYTIPSLIDVFIVFAGMYFGMISIIIIVVILNNRYQTKKNR